jgi:hypothetical protein
VPIFREQVGMSAFALSVFSLMDSAKAGAAMIAAIANAAPKRSDVETRML